MKVHDGINWHAFARVAKYSPDQVRWAQRKSGLLEPSGALLAAFFAAPEDGFSEADGNLLVTVGLNQMTNLLIGGGAQAFSHANAIVGVGASSTAAAITDTALGSDNTANAWYQQADASNPTQSNGVITCIATFATGNANFAWNEWCFAFGGGTAITAGIRLSLMTTTPPTMMNHKIQSLGTKGSGAAWVLTATLTIS